MNSPTVAYIHRLLHRFQPKPWRKKRQDFSAFALTYILRLSSCTVMGDFVISPLPRLLTKELCAAGPPLLHGRCPVSTLLRTQPPPYYRKLHLCVDEQTGEVVAGELTSKRARDSSRVASLVGQIDSPISSARADTAYDASGVYEAIENHSAHRSPRVLIPPRKGALLASGPASSRQRNRNIAAQARLGKRKWHTESGYSKRSKVETTFHHYKAIVGSAMRARGLAAQRVEARIGCKILNTMTALGMPDSEMIG